MYSNLLKVLVLISLMLISCSNEKSPQDSEPEQLRDLFDYKKISRRSIENKIDLLCLKYGIVNASTENKLVEFLYNLKIGSNEIVNGNSDISSEGLLEYLSKPSNYNDNDAVRQLAKECDISEKVVAALLYDYEIWEAADDCKSAQ